MLICFSILDKLCQRVRDPPGFIGASKFSVNGLGLIGSSNSEDSLLLQMVKDSLTYYDLRSVLSGKNTAYSVE
jgi:hypothetical protein